MRELKAAKMLTGIKKASSVFGIRPDVIDEALSELQELTQEKSCEGCESWWRVEMGRELQNFGYCTCKVGNIPRTEGITQSDFYCKYYTPIGVGV